MLEQRREPDGKALRLAQAARGNRGFRWTSYRIKYNSILLFMEFRQQLSSCPPVPPGRQGCKEKKMSVVTAVAVQSRAPIWPILAAPFAAGIYYLAIKPAFSLSIVAVLGETSPNDINLADIVSPVWARTGFIAYLAEFISAGLAMFIAAGLAHGRERAAGITGGCTISFFFIARVATHLYTKIYGPRVLSAGAMV
jgi:hypothetical protein